jgi:phosphoglycolate phosphatase
MITPDMANETGLLLSGNEDGEVGMGYSGVIFDLDGTLLNTLDDLANSMNNVLKEHGFPPHAVAKYRYFVCNGLEKLVQRALPPETQDQKMVELCVLELEKEYGERWQELTRPYEGIDELVDQLASMEIRISVLSNKPDQFTKIIIDKYFGLNHFNYVIGSRIGIPKKPDPFSALEIARLSKISPSDYLYLGDSGVDMKTANAAGMYAVGATWGFREVDELLENGSKALISSPLELVKLLG